MVNNEILTFVKDQTSQGKTREEIRDLLVTHGGWDDKDVDEAFETIQLSGISMPHVLEKMERKPLSPVVEQGNAARAFLQDRLAPKVMEPASSVEPAVSAEKKAEIPPILATSPLTSPEPGISSPTPVVEVKTTSPIDALSEIRKKFSASVPAPKVSTPQANTSRPNSSSRVDALSSKNPPLSSLDKTVATPSSSPFAIFQPKPASPVFIDMNSRQEAKKTNEDVMVTPFPSTSPAVEPGSKNNTIVAPTTVVQKITPPPSPITISGKPKGRKTLGFVMFLTGIILGAIIMHAYLSGYLDPLISFIFRTGK